MVNVRAIVGLFGVVLAGVVVQNPQAALGQACGDASVFLSAASPSVSAPSGYEISPKPSPGRIAGQAVQLGGTVRREGCQSTSERVAIEDRNVATQAWVYRGAVSTDEQGEFKYVVRPPYTAQVRARATTDGATSPPVTLPERTRVSTNFRAQGNCSLRVFGSVYPSRAGATVKIQQRVVVDGRVTGYSTAGTARTDGRGVYDQTLRLPCGRYAIASYNGATPNSEAGRTEYTRLSVPNTR